MDRGVSTEGGYEATTDKAGLQGGRGETLKIPAPPPLLPWGADGWWGHQFNFERETSQ